MSIYYIVASLSSMQTFCEIMIVHTISLVLKIRYYHNIIIFSVGVIGLFKRINRQNYNYYLVQS